ncbi:hypothetical protein GE09DRAFT_493473 [Coniochaeta sp. 2T2.1]|nr:hypothetical protein GE09DRAFT_493473 [Coniochaeta sp. 2T2.1]
MDGDIAGFVGITGAREEAARTILEMCGGDLEQAIQLWYNDEDLQRNLNNPSPPQAGAGAGPGASSGSSSSRAPPPVPHSTRPPRGPVGHEDDNGVIHIDSDDTDDDNNMDVDSDDGYEAAAVASRAQEEEDAAMAQRLQEELYGGGGAGPGPAGAQDDDGVRAPIARVTETLVAPGGGGGMYGEDDDDEQDDMNARVLEQLRRRRAAQPPRQRTNPFSQSIWDEPRVPGQPPVPAAADSSSNMTSRQQRLADLFRPPYQLMSSHAIWDDAREQGKEEEKWLLVNLQDMTDFRCQALNRDIWKNEAVADLVRENFIFLQYDKDDPIAQQYISFYFPNRAHENPNNYPHVSIVDPRTGEQVKVWSGVPFPDATDFHAQLAEFLDRYSLDPQAKNPVVKQKRPERVVDVDRMTEEEMLAAAIANSMANVNGSGESSSTPDLVDPDALTKSVGDLASSSAVAQSEPAAAVEPEEESAFAKIPSDRPHVEPENNPATTTRIQFRHPNGRVIRRFTVDDPVQRLYEWLKADPLEGKEGVAFELKSMPSGQDLISEVAKTIGEVGLKQGTVMIEFLED